MAKDESFSELQQADVAVKRAGRIKRWHLLVGSFRQAPFEALVEMRR